jgi:hypothetical protein
MISKDLKNQLLERQFHLLEVFANNLRRLRHAEGSVASRLAYEADVRLFG